MTCCAASAPCSRTRNIRPAQVYHDVKITGAESELYAVHEPVLRTRLGDFGEDFLGRTLGALLISGADYVQASRWRRVLIAEMAPLYAKYDVLVTAAPGPAPRLESWRTISFWQKPSLTTPFNVLGGPALAQCIGYTPDGLPLSMQIVGRPFDDATVLRVAHAYEVRDTVARAQAGAGTERRGLHRASADPGPCTAGDRCRAAR